MLENACEKNSNRTAYVNFGKSITYGQLDKMSKKLAAYLQSKLNKGDAVAIMLPNLLQYPIAVFAILRAGMIVTNTNPLYTPRELKHQLNDSSAKAIIVIENYACTLAEIVKESPIELVITTQIGDLLGTIKGSVMNFIIKKVKKMVPDFKLDNTISFNQVLKAGQSLTFTATKSSLDDIAFLQYTGGTTGVSKGAMLTNRNMVSNVEQVRAWNHNSLQEGKEIVITALPLYHVFALNANCLLFTEYGAKNILITNPRDMPGFVKELSHHKFTAMTGVNTLFNGLLNTPGFADLDFSRFRFALGGGMAVQRDTAARWKETTGVTLVEAYGLTETCPAACMNPTDLKEYNGMIGLPISSTECEIRDDDDNVLPVGERGELCIRGPQVMKGYLNRPEATAETIDKNGWLKTGDIATMNNDGFFKIVDRKKDMILVSGFNVYPNEIEDAACLHPNIIECAAIGLPDPKSGEIVKLFVVVKITMTVQEVKDHCRENLTGYKVPRHVEFKEELPKSNVGKILRKDLRPN
ncbi:MAG: AMP-binding protein [Alcanivoracaceae bacterium]|nr:AMP-binding protein [Alcanivoracaceae bacterium]